MENKNTQAFSQFHGLTKREYIATKILAGLCSNNSINPKDKSNIEIIVELTDELLKQLEK